MIKKNFQIIYNYESRLHFVNKCKIQSPNSVPVFLYPASPYYQKVRLKTNKYIVRKDMSVAQFLYFIRGCLHPSISQGIILFTDQGGLPNISNSMGELYDRYVDIDGFLYLQIAMESVFG